MGKCSLFVTVAFMHNGVPWINGNFGREPESCIYRVNCRQATIWAFIVITVSSFPSTVNPKPWTLWTSETWTRMRLPSAMNNERISDWWVDQLRDGVDSRRPKLIRFTPNDCFRWRAWNPDAVRSGTKNLLIANPAKFGSYPAQNMDPAMFSVANMFGSDSGEAQESLRLPVQISSFLLLFSKGLVLWVLSLFLPYSFPNTKP